MFHRTTKISRPFGRIDDGRLYPANNELTLVRLVLASLVIWTHCYWITTGIEGSDELQPIIGKPLSHLAVNGFFFISGFLICQSITKRKSALGYVLARLSRLWPALFVSTIITVFFGLFISNDYYEFIENADTIKYIFYNISMMKGWYYLPAFLCEGGRCIVNGSLWTIPWEVRCYALLGLAYAMPAQVRAETITWLAALGLLLIASWHITGDPSSANDGLAYNLQVFSRLWGMFSFGVLAFSLRRFVILSKSGSMFLIVIALIEFQAMGTNYILPLSTGYALLVLSFFGKGQGSLSGDWPDYSYGIYIYSFPVMVVIDKIISPVNHYYLAALNFIFVLPLAALSWHVVEKPSLRLVKQLQDRAGRRSHGQYSG